MLCQHAFNQEPTLGGIPRPAVQGAFFGERMGHQLVLAPFQQHFVCVMLRRGVMLLHGTRHRIRERREASEHVRVMTFHRFHGFGLRGGVLLRHMVHGASLALCAHAVRRAAPHRAWTGLTHFHSTAARAGGTGSLGPTTL
ncbi:hypothetical protein D9M72_611010 [compost metagenome]